MKNIKNKQDQFEVLRKIEANPRFSQRQLATNLGFSLGKLNYCLRELKQKGFVKIQNFNQKEDKLTYLKYMLTPKGIAFRTKLTINFMKRKMKEYDELKSELDKIK